MVLESENIGLKSEEYRLCSTEEVALEMRMKKAWMNEMANMEAIIIGKIAIKLYCLELKKLKACNGTVAIRWMSAPGLRPTARSKMKSSSNSA